MMSYWRTWLALLCLSRIAGAAAGPSPEADSVYRHGYEDGRKYAQVVGTLALVPGPMTCLFPGIPALRAVFWDDPKAEKRQELGCACLTAPIAPGVGFLGYTLEAHLQAASKLDKQRLGVMPVESYADGYRAGYRAECHRIATKYLLYTGVASAAMVAVTAIAYVLASN